MAINPTGSALKALLGEDDGGPLYMLNLLRFVEGGRSDLSWCRWPARPQPERVVSGFEQVTAP